MPNDTELTNDEPEELFPAWARAIPSFANRAADTLARYQYLAVALFSVLYLLATCFRASRKLFWFDELFTLYISRLPDMAAVWAALKQGLDFNPPLFYAMTKFAESVFGENHVSVRLPEIAGFWIFCLCLFRFVSSRTTPLAGLVAMLFPLVTTSYFYAYEARSHGAVLGFAGLALVCWQSAVHGSRRIPWLLGLFTALLCAMLTHTYAVLLFIPLTLAEFARSLKLKRIDWPVWAAILLPSLGILVSLPLIRASKGLPKGVYPARGSVLVTAYQSHFGTVSGLLVTALVLFCLYQLFFSNRSGPPNQGKSMDLPELIALIAFVGQPFFAFLIARITGAPYYDRYSVSAVLGVAALLGILTAGRPLVGLGLLAFLLAQIGIDLGQFALTISINEPSTSVPLPTRAYGFADEYDQMEAAADRSTPLVLLDYLQFLPIIHYAPPRLASRMFYLVLPGGDSNGDGYTLLTRQCHAPGNPVPRSDFLEKRQPFLALCTNRALHRLDAIVKTGADVKIVHVLANSFLVLVTFDKKGDLPTRLQ